MRSSDPLARSYAVPRRRVRLHPEAQRDFDLGVDWYLRHSPLAAERFVNEVRAALTLVGEAPQRWPLLTKDLRRYVMASFPYSVIYRAVGSEVHVYAVAHAKRRPDYWRRRRFKE